MTKIPPVQMSQYQIPIQPTYNAVKIDISNPQVNAPGCTQIPVQQSCCSDSIYSYPQTPIYEIPKQTIYQPQPVTVTGQTPAGKEIPAAKPETSVVNKPSEVKEVPTVPPPVIVKPEPIAQTKASVGKIEAAAPVAASTVATPIVATATAKPETPAKAQTIEVKTPESAKQSAAASDKNNKVDINEFISKLTSPDYEQQANALEGIAGIAVSSPQQTADLIDPKVFDSLLKIMNQDSSKLEGPTAQQLGIREKIISGKPVTDAEKADANKISPMEQVERNKQYAIYTAAILDEIYISEIQKMSQNTVPLTELPAAAGIVEQVKNNPNPMVKVAGINALSFIQRPDYQKDLATIFTVAQKDSDSVVKDAATKALERLSKMPPAPAPQAPEPAAKTAIQAAKAPETTTKTPAQEAQKATK